MLTLMMSLSLPLAAPDNLISNTVIEASAVNAFCIRTDANNS